MTPALLRPPVLPPPPEISMRPSMSSFSTRPVVCWGGPVRVYDCASEAHSNERWRGHCDSGQWLTDRTDSQRQQQSRLRHSIAAEQLISLITPFVCLSGVQCDLHPSTDGCDGSDSGRASAGPFSLPRAGRAGMRQHHRRELQHGTANRQGSVLCSTIRIHSVWYESGVGAQQLAMPMRRLTLPSLVAASAVIGSRCVSLRHQPCQR